MSEYYDGTKLLSLNDINGNKPEIYMVCGNRTGGKTTYFYRLCVNRFLKKGAKFCVLYRFGYELDSVEDSFFKGIKSLFFNEYNMTSEKRIRGLFRELYLNDIPCGYAIALNTADQIKKNSQIFVDVENIVMDEFQSETNKYCPDEITKFRSVHTSIARGNGQYVRYVPVYMMSNAVTMLNPYYTAFGLSTRLQADTRFLRSKGLVMEQAYIKGAAEAQKLSGFNQAFVDDDYLAYSAENVYLNDSQTFIEKVSGSSKYVCTFIYKNKHYAIRLFPEMGIAYCDDKADITFPVKVAVTTNDMRINYVALKENNILVSTMRYYFNHGCFRFKNLICKEAILNFISY